MKERGFLDMWSLILFFILLVFIVTIAFVLTDGFRVFGKAPWPPAQSAETITVKAQCGEACSVNKVMTFCCKKFYISGKEIMCYDVRLEVSCKIDCSNVVCNG